MIANKSEIRLDAWGSSCRLVVSNRADDGDELLAAAREELRRLELKFGTYHSDSIISRINQLAGTGSFTQLDPEALSLFQYVTALWDESKHLFDPTTRILQDRYDESGRPLASKQQLQDMLQLIGWSKLEITSKGASLPDQGMLIDLDSCIRPYAVDSVRKLFLKQGVSNALIEIDQDIATIGKQADGANWLIGVRFPRGGSAGITRLKLNHRGYAMRGDFERCITEAGERFGRALSPIDGLAIPGLVSVAVIADNCLTACSAASVARLKTEQAAIKWLESIGLPWFAIDRNLHCHGPLAPQSS